MRRALCRSIKDHGNPGVVQGFAKTQPRAELAAGREAGDEYQVAALGCVTRRKSTSTGDPHSPTTCPGPASQ
jgi:hypothetical protein